MANSGKLVLEDGTIWTGISIGATGTAFGEVVFNTSMTGYQEILTDPSYAGQIVVMTAPQIGNTGINIEDNESKCAFLRGFIIRDYSPHVSNWRATASLDTWLSEQNIIAISDIDTRALTRKLRDVGSLKAIITTDKTLSNEDTIQQAQAWQGLDNIDLVKDVTCDEIYQWDDPSAAIWEFKQYRGNIDPPPTHLHVVVYDFGLKHNILRRLASFGCKITIVPASTPSETVLELAPDGVLLSNGPGDPSALPYAVENTQALIGRVPVFGICLGHQIIGQAVGGTTFRLKFGHHGGNQPVSHLPTKRVEISSHNHNFAVDPTTLSDEIEITHLNLNDDCCEGLRHKTLPLMSVQYHPEAAPGPHDSDLLFDDFVKMMIENKSQ